MARPARGSVTPRGEGRGTPRGARGEQQVEGKTQSVVPAGKIMTCATPRANERERERAASNRMNSCRPRPASPQMKLEGIQYESSLSPSFSSFKLSPTGTSTEAREGGREAGEPCLKDEPGGKKAKVPLDSAFQRRRRLRPSRGGANIPPACRYILKRAETFVSEGSMRARRRTRTDDEQTYRWTCGAK